MQKRWGWMLTLLKGKHFKVKVLYFKPGCAISMQRHKHRSELWLFVFGSGEFYKNNGSCQVKKGQYKNVEQHVWHQFTAKVPTLVLEVQYGAKCSDRDIERK